MLVDLYDFSSDIPIFQNWNLKNWIHNYGGKYQNSCQQSAQENVQKQLLNSVIAKYRDSSARQCLSLRVWQIIDLLAISKS